MSVMVQKPQSASGMRSTIELAPEHYPSPEEQLERAHRLWPTAALPKPPKSFASPSRERKLLLHVPDTFDHLWSKVQVPDGWQKHPSGP